MNSILQFSGTLNTKNKDENEKIFKNAKEQLSCYIIIFLFQWKLGSASSYMTHSVFNCTLIVAKTAVMVSFHLNAIISKVSCCSIDFQTRRFIVFVSLTWIIPAVWLNKQHSRTSSRLFVLLKQVVSEIKLTGKKWEQNTRFVYLHIISLTVSGNCFVIWNNHIRA